MAWEKLIRSGSNAHLNQVTASAFIGNGSALTGIVAISASYAATASKGGGIYGGSGIIPTDTYSTITDTFNIYVPLGAEFRINGDANAALLVDSDKTIIRGLREGDEHFSLQLNGSTQTASFRDISSSPLGLQYESDYGSTIRNNTRSIPDVGTIRNHLTASYAISASWSPSSAGGNGIYGGSGTIPTNTTAIITDNFNIDIPLGASFYISGDATDALYIDSDNTRIRGLRDGDEHFVFRLIGATYSASFYDPSPTPLGIQYWSNYGTTIRANDRSIPDVGTIRNHLTASYAISASYYQETKSFGLTIDGGGSAITTGIKGDITVPFNCYVDSWYLTADQVGSIVIDVWKDTFANFPPTVLDTIAGTEKPTLSSAASNFDTNLTTWTRSVVAGDVIRFNVDSASTITRANLVIKVLK